MSSEPHDSFDWYAEDIATFGDRLAGAREAMGLSQDELAKRLGVKTKTLAAWENDQNEPRANRLQMLSGLLNVSMRWLLTGRGLELEAPRQTAGDADLARLLLDLRQVRTEHARLGERMGRLEKQLRQIVEGEEG